MKAFLVAVVVSCLCSAVAIAQQPLTISPAKPKPGEKVIITYNTSGTTMFGLESFDGTAYLFEGTSPIAKEIKLTKEGNVYKGEVPTNDSTQAIFFTFAKDEKRDNNSDAGYYTMLYNKEGAPVSGARASISSGFFNWGGLWALKRDPDKSLKWLKDEVANNPAYTEKKAIEYLSQLALSKDEADKAAAKAFAEKLAVSPKVTEAELSSVSAILERSLKDKPAADKITANLKAKFPDGTWKKTEKVNAFYAEKDAAKKEALYKELVTAFPPNTEAEKKGIANYAYSVASAYATEKNIEKFKEYAAMVTDKGLLAGLYNNIAWKESGESINAAPGNLELGKELSAKSLELIKDLMANGSKDKPPFYTDAQFKKQLEGSYYMYADTYALLLFHSKDYEKAYQLQKEVLESNKRRDISGNEAFAAYVEKIKGPAEAQRELEAFIRDGRYSPGMKEQLKKIYTSNGKSDADWTLYVDELEKVSKAKRREELAKSMINEAAPDFKLKDIDGSEVSLASLKGKIVIVDFWATWCGPCIASFPGMKKAVEKYKADPNVKFVFIDTWENGEKDKVKKNVGDFIEKNAYPFHVLMDYDSKIVEQFKVEGIPTKFVIDGNKKIRFRSVGFGGSTDGLVDELGQMIEMARSGGSGEPAKKAF